jgi:hypothetical protein
MEDVIMGKISGNVGWISVEIFVIVSSTRIYDGVSFWGTYQTEYF